MNREGCKIERYIPLKTRTYIITSYLNVLITFSCTFTRKRMLSCYHTLPRTHSFILASRINQTMPACCCTSRACCWSMKNVLAWILIAHIRWTISLYCVVYSHRAVITSKGWEATSAMMWRRPTGYGAITSSVSLILSRPVEVVVRLSILFPTSPPYHSPLITIPTRLWRPAEDPTPPRIALCRWGMPKAMP
jgi:hypothetical protein